MYGCSSLLNISYRSPILLAAIGLTGLISQTGNPGPGERYGTADSLAKIEQKLVSERSELRVQSDLIRVNFDKLNAQPTEDQVRLVLKQTDACTDVNVRGIMTDPDQSRQAAFILYLDAFSKGGIKQADSLFVHNPPQKK